MDLNKFNKIEPYSLAKSDKEKLLFEALMYLTKYHYDKCGYYKNIIDKLHIDKNTIKTTRDIPFIPVRLFKEFELKSVSNEEVFKMLTSSGTSGQSVSKIYLDKINIANQTKTLAHIITCLLYTSPSPRD